MVTARRAHARRHGIAVVAAAGCLGGTVLLGAPPAAASGAQVYAVPPSGVLAITGHGWGHGHGMSQYGAYGAAKVKGLTYQQILAFYYPHTTVAGLPLSTKVRVLLHGTSSSQLVVRAASAGHTLTASTDVAGVPACSLPASLDGGKTTVQEWRVRVTSTSTGTALRLGDSTDGSSWHAANPAGCDKAWSAPIAGTVTFTDSAGATTLVRSGGSTAYRGALRAAFTGAAVVDVNVVPMDSYLRSVVPSEMPSSWSPAALEAQAVAARTYAAYGVAHPKSRYFDVFDDTRDQMYTGKPAEATTSTAAVQGTEDPTAKTGVILDDAGGHPAFTQFSSSDGGWTVDGGQPYLPAQRDPYDGLVPSSVHTWHTSLSAQSVGAAFGSTLGTLRSLTVTARDGHGAWGGRVETLTLHGSAGDVTLTGTQFRSDVGLRSEWFTVVEPPGAPREVQTAISGNSISVSWQAPAPNGGAAVTGYHVVAQPSGVAVDVGASATSATLTGVTHPEDAVVTVTPASSSGRGWPAQVTTKVARIGGSATDVAVSKATYADGAAGAVVLVARGRPAYAMGAVPLAALEHAPVLFTAGSSLSSSAAAELRRVLPAGGRVYLLGPTSVLSANVASAVSAAGFRVKRYAGSTPGATARAVATAVARAGAVSRVFEVSTGDAVLAGPAGVAAARRHGVLLVTDGSKPDPDTAAWLRHHPAVSKRVAVGNDAVAADPSARPVKGTDDAAVSAAVAQAWFGTAAHAAVTSAGSALSVLSAAARLGRLGGPVLLVPAAALPAADGAYLHQGRAALTSVELVGPRLPYEDVEQDTQDALLP